MYKHLFGSVCLCAFEMTGFCVSILGMFNVMSDSHAASLERCQMKQYFARRFNRKKPLTQIHENKSQFDEGVIFMNVWWIINKKSQLFDITSAKELK